MRIVTLPTYAFAYYERGVAYGWLRRFDQALEDLNRALELDPLDDFSYYDRGIILLGLRKKEQAYIDFNYAYQLNPIDIEPLWVHCWAHMSKDGKDEKTMKQIEELTKKSSLLKYVTDRDIEYICRGVVLGLRGDFEAGLGWLEQVTSFLPSVVWSSFFWKGLFYAFYGEDPHKAIEMIEKAIDDGMPPILLIPLYWLKEDNPIFFETYALPILRKYSV
jgi:tetratricopeptide (TPR) repeat protein